MYRGKRLRRRHEETVKHEDTNKPLEETKDNNNSIHDDPDAFIYKENEDYGDKKVDNKKTVDKKVDQVEYETKVKTTIDDSVNVHKKKMTIDMPLTKEEVDKLNKKELENGPNREYIPTGILDKGIVGNTLANDAMMVTSIQSQSSTFNLYDFFQGYGSTFSEYITKLYRSGKIKYKNVTIDFSYKDSNSLDNYTNTTLYDRAQYTFTEEDTENSIEKVEKGMLVAGDILTYTIDTTNGKDSTGTAVSGNVRFNVAFYITEVKVKDSQGKETVTSKIKTGIIDEPPETILSENGTDIISTAKDTNGNVYAIRKGKTLEDVSAFLQTETVATATPPYDTLRVLEPTNKSKFSYYNNEYEPNYGATFKDNHLFFSNKFGYDSLTAPHPDMTGSVILPDSFPSNPATANTEIQPFDCYVKGYFVVYRVGILSTKNPQKVEEGDAINTSYISQTYSFEMNEWSRIVCEKTTGATPKMIIQTDWFTSDITDKQLYLNPFNSNISAPFCGSDGWFRTNCTNSLNPLANNVFGIATITDVNNTDVISTTDKTGFCILSPNDFVGSKNYQLIEEVLCDDSDQSIFDENDDEIVKSQKVSRSIQEKKSSGCCIV